MNIDFYCDNTHHELYDKHPDAFHHDKPGMRDNWFLSHNSSSYHYLWQTFKKYEWFPDRFMNLNLVSPPLHWLSNHYAY